jgi:hypothetical protein
MAERRVAIAAWSGAVCAISIASATLIATLEKTPSANPWFDPSIGLAVASFVILIASEVAMWNRCNGGQFHRRTLVRISPALSVGNLTTRQ